MERRKFLRNSSLVSLGAALLPATGLWAKQKDKAGLTKPGSAKNIIFLVSDGMSTGTLNMAHLLMQRKEGRRGAWVGLYEDQKAVRAFMDTAAYDSLVTDSAAASSSWGGGKRVPNGSLNVNADGSWNKPLLQKFKAAGKAVGCVTTVPITHATPAGFCVNSDKRDSQPEIAEQYLSLRFDVMMGGGLEFFHKDKRKDKQDLLQQYKDAGFTVARDKATMQAAPKGRPLLGVFHEDALPYSIDAAADNSLSSAIPTLAEMTQTALDHLSRQPEGFVIQVEGGKVDWAAHANDTAALLYDQIAFDDAVRVAVAFAELHQDTLVVVTTDHGNANPGLFKSKENDVKFDKIQQFRHSNDWILNGIGVRDTPAQVRERIEAATGIGIKMEEATSLAEKYKGLSEEGVYNYRHLPFKELSQIMQRYTSVGYGAMDHSADYVELAMLGPGSALLPPFIKNYELHHFLLQATGLVE